MTPQSRSDGLNVGLESVYKFFYPSTYKGFREANYDCSMEVIGIETPKLLTINCKERTEKLIER